jgi:carboxyl-terminal processing protease
MRTSRLFGLALAMAVTFSAPAFAQTADHLHEKPINGLELLNEAYELTRRNFYSRRVLEQKGWSKIRDKYVSKAKQASGQEEIHQIISAMLGELKTSHLAIVDKDVYWRHLDAEFKNRQVPQLGFEFVEAEYRQLFVGGMLEGSAADKAGLKTGDKILKIGKYPAIDNENLREGGHDPGLPGHHGYVLLCDNNEKISLTIQRTAKSQPEEITITATPINMIAAIKNSVRVVKHDGYKIGIVHTWHFMSTTVSRLVRDAIENKFRNCDGMILDVRGRGGSTMVVSQLLNMFRNRRAIWKKPVVCLTDHGSRSAKEIFSWAWQRDKIGEVVGETTQGACIGTIFKELKDGSWMLLPRTDVKRLTGGVEIEGVGVKPSIFQKQAPLPFRQGKDTILDRGLSVLSKKIVARGTMRSKPAPKKPGTKLYRQR